MRLLMIPTARFSCQVESGNIQAFGHQETVDASRVVTSDSLIVLATIEQGDEAVADPITRKAAEEIAHACDDLLVSKVVICPYSHLAPHPVDLETASQILRSICNRLYSRAVVLLPFGWDSSFSLESGCGVRSHRLIEISRECLGGFVRRSEHPVSSLNQRLRQVFLDLELEEVINPSIVNEAEVYKQYGPEAPIILDRVFYLAGLPRPDIGVSNTEMGKIQVIAPGFRSKESLEDLLRDYKRGAIDSDDLTVQMAQRLGLDERQVIRIIDDVFPQFKMLEPIATRKTLRSHMTALWFPALASLQHEQPLPIRLFAIGPRFRREQREDERHLFESTAVSVVIMDTDFSLDEGHELTQQILGRLGFQTCDFRLKPVASNYYASGTDTEVYVEFEGRDLEVANLGFYSEAALANYGIEYPVFNVGFGSERLAMAFRHAPDIRRMVYPQFFRQEEYTDAEIASLLRPEKEPRSQLGRLLVNDLVMTALANKAQVGPAEVVAYDGDLLNAHVRISLYNWDAGKSLFGSASMNRVFVYDGGIFGVPVEEVAGLDDMTGQSEPVRILHRAWKDGVDTGMWLIELMMKQAVAELESAVKRHESAFDMKVKALKRPSHINIFVPKSVEEFIEMRKRPVKVVGPVFAGVKAEISY